jgi:uncharacterized protein YbaA (DUF1428 family)
MSRYVDGFVIPIKKSKVAAYKKMATLGRKVWMEHGALDYYECVGAKLANKWGMPFPKVFKLKSNETLIFAFVVYKSKAHRESVNKKVMKDSRMHTENFEMPFDMKRFSAGEFKTIVHA